MAVDHTPYCAEAANQTMNKWQSSIQILQKK